MRICSVFSFVLIRTALPPYKFIECYRRSDLRHILFSSIVTSTAICEDGLGSLFFCFILHVGDYQAEDTVVPLLENPPFKKYLKHSYPTLRYKIIVTMTHRTENES